MSKIIPKKLTVLLYLKFSLAWNFGYNNDICGIFLNIAVEHYCYNI